jgi:hypothetical protein
MSPRPQARANLDQLPGHGSDSNAAGDSLDHLGMRASTAIASCKLLQEAAELWAPRRGRACQNWPLFSNHSLGTHAESRHSSLVQVVSTDSIRVIIRVTNWFLNYSHLRVKTYP